MQVVVNGSDTYLWPFALGILIVLVVRWWHRTYSSSHLICFFVFGIYLLFALDKALFPLRITEEYAVSARQWLWAINLIPFKFSPTEVPNILFLQIFQNILLTIPFGFGLNFVTPLRAKSFLWLAPAVGLGIEGSQLVIGLMLRYPYRIIDITDALLNAFGVLIGYGFFTVFAWFYIQIAQRLKMELGGLAAYFYTVSRRASVSRESSTSTL